MLKRITARRLRGGRTAALALTTAAVLTGLGVASPAAAVTTTAVTDEAASLYCTITRTTPLRNSPAGRIIGTLYAGDTFRIIDFEPQGYLYGEPESRPELHYGNVLAAHCDW